MLCLVLQSREQLVQSILLDQTPPPPDSQAIDTNLHWSYAGLAAALAAVLSSLGRGFCFLLMTGFPDPAVSGADEGGFPMLPNPVPLRRKCALCSQQSCI